MIAVIDYKTGNLFSLTAALERLDEEYVITSSQEKILAADHVILPGVGEASNAMAALREKGLDSVIPIIKAPILGICIGMQLMCKSSEEGGAKCLGIFDNVVKKISGKEIKVPHMGWNSITQLKTGLFEGIDDGSYLYFVHSYAPETGASTIALTDYGVAFSSALSKDNFFGTQFHPEKSGEVGERILKNFVNIKIR